MTDKAKDQEALVYTDVEAVENKIDRTVGPQDFPEIESAIRSAQEEIDRFTNHAWRTRVRTEQKERSFSRRHRAGIPVYLDRMEIQTVNSLEVSTGLDTVDYIADSAYDEGRNKDYWVEENEGKIYIRTLQRFEKAEWIEVEYEYGEDHVPPDIKKACTLLAAAEMTDAEGGSYMLPEGGDATPIETKAERYRKEAKEKLKRHQHYVPVTP